MPIYMLIHVQKGKKVKLVSVYPSKRAISGGSKILTYFFTQNAQASTSATVTASTRFELASSYARVTSIKSSKQQSVS